MSQLAMVDATVPVELHPQVMAMANEYKARAKAEARGKANP